MRIKYRKNRMGIKLKKMGGRTGKTNSREKK